MSYSLKIYDIKNLKVILVKDDRQSVTVQAILGSGSREESNIDAGCAHFLEHFVFKGTNKYPNMHDFNESVEKVGGSFNAYTKEDEMGFWVKMSKSNINLAIELVSEILQNPLLPKEHFDKERGTILEELNMYQDNPVSKASENLQKIMYGDSNLGRPIIGTNESLNNLKVEDLLRYQKKWFIPKNIIIGIVGNYKSDEFALELINKHFDKLINNDSTLPLKDVFKWDTQIKPKKILTSRKLDQAKIYLGFRGLSLNKSLKDRTALKVINLILGGGWMSRLFKEIRENRGWAYSIGSYYTMYSDVGDLQIGAGVPKDKLKDTIDLILQISYGLSCRSDWKITQNEIEIAKNTLIGRLDLNYDKPEFVLGRALYDLMFENTIYTIEQIKEEINNVNLVKVKEICDIIFKPQNLSVSVVGDYKKLDLDL